MYLLRTQNLFGFSAAKTMKPKYTFLVQFFYAFSENVIIFFREMNNNKVMASQTEKIL